VRDVGDARIEIEETLAQIDSQPAGRRAVSEPISQPISHPIVPEAPARFGRRALLIAAVVLLAGAAVGMWSFLRQSPKLPDQKYLAVLPFKDLSGLPGGQLIGDSLVETVSVRLSEVRGIQVVTPAASFTAYDRETEIYRIAKDLGANLLLRGTYQRQGDVVRITYSVLNTRDGIQVAAGSLDGSASDLFGMQDQLTDRVAGALRLPTGPRRTPSPSGLETASEQDRYLRAIGALQRYDKAERIDEAIRLLEPLAGERPASALVQAALGRAYLYKFNLTRDARWVALASTACTRARGLLPESPEVNVTFGELSLRTGKAADAVAAYRRALAAQPNNIDARLGLARAYDAAGDGRLSEENYKRAIELQPAYFGGYSKLAGFYYTHGKWAPAAEMFRKVTELTPDNAHAFANLGATYAELGQFDRALDVFRKSVALEPSDLAYSNIGTAQYYLGRYADSAVAFEKAIALAPSHYLVWANLGDALRLIPGNAAKSREAYEKAITLARAELGTNPDDAVVHSYLALCLAKTGRAAEARDHVRRSLRTGAESESPELFFNAAVVANRASRSDEALEYLGRAVRGGFNAAIIRNEPELANLRNRDDFDDVVKGHRRESSR
jgi:serine/threonine-protein kinase